MRKWRNLLGALAASTAGSVAAAEAPPARPLAQFDTTLGALTIELWPHKAPATVANFLALVDDGFYRGTIFHRVIPGFMIQAGGYDANLAPREARRQVVNESANGERNLRWTVAMARHGDPDSAAAQFYVNMVDNAHLDATPGKPGYTVFGRLVDGEAVADAIEMSETATVEGTPNVPVEAIVILDARRLSAGAGG